MILEQDQVAAWLAGPDLSLLKSYEGSITIAPANKAVCNVKNRGPELPVPTDPVPPAQGGFHD